MEWKPVTRSLAKIKKPQEKYFGEREISNNKEYSLSHNKNNNK